MRPLHDFVTRFAAMLDRHRAEPDILHHGAALLAELVAHDDWLPDEYTQPDAKYPASPIPGCQIFGPYEFFSRVYAKPTLILPTL
jgi:hypothetical protein